MTGGAAEGDLAAWVVADFVGSDASRWVMVLAAAGAAAALVASVPVVLGRRGRHVERALAGYEPPSREAGEPAASRSRSVDGPQGPIPPAETAVVQSGIDLATRLAARSGALGRLERLLEQADVPLRAGELCFYLPVVAILTFLAGAVLFGPLIGLVAAGTLLVAPIAVLERRRSRRLQQFARMLPGTLSLLAGSLRAGFSLMQGLEAVAQESSDPMRRELQRVFTEVRLGRTVEDALGDVADRMASTDLAWTVMAITIQREVGGNLALLLDTVADTMQQRERLRREVRALTAEGRLSAVILTLFPPGIALALAILNPGYLEILLDHTIGIIAIVAAVAANIVGWIWLRRVIDVEA